jgi:hypothetical protein
VSRCVPPLMVSGSATSKRHTHTHTHHPAAAKDKLWSQYDVEGFKRLLAASDFIGACQDSKALCVGRGG